MIESILKTKLNRPARRAGSVARVGLMARLNEGERKLTLMCAPAGFGKTTLAAEWLAQLPSSHTSAWLSLSEDDNDDTPRWLGSLIGALQTAVPGLGAGVLMELQARPHLPIKGALTVLINELASADKTIVLALDDYHLITDEAIHNALAFLIDHAPPTLQVVITTRTQPPLPLARWRARGQLAELHTDDLRFTSAEAAKFLQGTMGLHISQDDMAVLEARTEGWIAGLQLAALAMRDQRDVSGFIAAFSGSNRYIVDYLTEEALNQQPPAIQTFLLRTSILNNLNAALCEAVVGDWGLVIGDSTQSLIPNHQSLLEHLERSNLFLIPLDAEGRCYRYHPLFADVLRERLKRTQPELVPVLHRRALDWYASSSCSSTNCQADAIRHALAGQSYERAADLVSEVASAMVHSGRIDTLMNWLKALPDALRRRPVLQMPHIWMSLSSGHFAAAELHLQALENQLDAEPEHDTPQLRGEIAAARSSMMVLAQDPRAVEQATQALSYLSQLAPTHSLRHLLQTNLANAYLNVGELDAAADLIHTSLSSGGGFVARAGLRHMLGQIRFVQGKLDEAQRLCEIIFEDAGKAKQDRSVGYAMTHSLLGAIAYDRNQLAEAEAHWQAGLKLATMWHVGIVEITCLFNLTRLALGREDVAAATNCLAQIDERLHGPSWIVALARHWITEIKIRVWLKQGDVAAAAHWAEQQNIEDIRAGWRVRDYRLFALARVYLAQGRWADAQTLLNEQLQRSTVVRFPMVKLWVRLLLAIAYHQQGDPTNAFAALEHALMQAATERRIRNFLDEGEPMHALLRAWRLHTAPSKHRDFADELLALFGDADPLRHNVAIQSLPERLSPREVEVLGLVADGLKNQEIGDKLYITRGTVRIHLNTIYGKLGVQNRVQAISRGREVGVLN